MTHETIKPWSKLWTLVGRCPNPPGMEGLALVYDHLDGSRIISGVEKPTEEGWEYHISITRKGRRATSQECRQILMGMDTTIKVEEWLEDNHQPGIARNFWVHTDPIKRGPCPCNATEEPITDGDFTWRKVPK